MILLKSFICAKLTYFLLLKNFQIFWLIIEILFIQIVFKLLIFQMHRWLILNLNIFIRLIYKIFEPLLFCHHRFTFLFNRKHAWFTGIIDQSNIFISINLHQFQYFFNICKCICFLIQLIEILALHLILIQLINILALHLGIFIKKSWL